MFLLAILRRSPKFQQFVSIFHDLRDGSKRILREKLCLSPRNPISEISIKCLDNFLVHVCEDILALKDVPFPTVIVNLDH